MYMYSWNDLLFLVFSESVSRNYDQDCRSFFFMAGSYSSFQELKDINIENCSHFYTFIGFPTCARTFGVENV